MAEGEKRISDRQGTEENLMGPQEVVEAKKSDDSGMPDSSPKIAEDTTGSWNEHVEYDRSRVAGKPQDSHTIAGMSRRTFSLGVGGALALLGLGGLKYLGTSSVVRPPGGQDENHLIASCVRCEKCCEVCPRGVIVPAYIETGIVNMRTPTFDFSDNYCDWCLEENGGEPLCVKVCPTEALKLPPGASDTNTIIGVAVLNESECLAYKLIGCKFCYDACPYEAIGLDKDNRPFVLEEKCNGCGACESVCVSLKNASLSSDAKERAIVIRPLENA